MGYFIFSLLNCRFQLFENSECLAIHNAYNKRIISFQFMYDNPFRLPVISLIISALDLGECLIQMTNYLCAKDKTCFEHHKHTFLLPICKVRQFQRFFSSPELKAQGELIVWDSSRVGPSVRPSTLSNMNISETSRLIVIKFHLEHYWGMGLAA